MTSESGSQKSILDEEGAKTFFNHILQIWIHPELNKRVQNGLISNDYQVTKAQVVLDPDKNSVEVRLNDEVKALAIAKLKPGIKKQFKEEIFEDEVAEIREIRLTDQDSPDAGHLTLLQLKGEWLIHFDFRHNKGRAKERYNAALQFYDTAKFCFEKQFWRAFVDNLFSSVELLATAQLFVTSEQEYIKRQSHAKTRLKYNSMMLVSKKNEDYKDLLNKLHGLVDGARYLSKPFEIKSEDAESYLKTLQDMVDFTKEFIA